MAAVSQPVIPAWVAPDHNAVRDVLNIAPVVGETNAYAAGVADAAQWVTGWPDVSYDDAGQRMSEALPDRADKHAAGVADVLAWLMGFGPAPINLPRRNPDGTLVSAEQLYEQRRAQSVWAWGPEERREQRQTAERDFARSARLAELG